MTSLELAKKAAHLLDEKKGGAGQRHRDPGDLQPGGLFRPGTGTSNTHVRALADELEEKLKAQGAGQPRTEGYRSNSWVLLDWGNVVVHVFTQEGREFYDLDRLWADGENDRLAAGGRGVSFPDLSRFRILPCEENEI